MKKILLILVLTTIKLHLNAQLFNWAAKISGVADELATCVAADDSSNTYVVGYFQSSITFTKSSGTITLTSAGSYDFFLAKYDCAGNAVWALKIGGTGNEKSPYTYAGVAFNNISNTIQICTSIEGNATAYSMNGSNQSLSASSSSRDAVIASYDLNGNIIWLNLYGSTGDDRVEAICTDRFGNIFARGEFENTVSFGATNLTSAGSHDVYLLKLSSSGSVLWVKKEGGSGEDASNNRIMADSIGNIYVNGNTAASLTILSRTITHIGPWGVYYVKYDPSGNLKWVVNASNTGAMAGPSIVVDKAFNVFITTSFKNSVTFYDANNSTINVNSNGTNYDIVLFKLDSNGKFLWNKKGNSTGAEITYNLMIDSKSNLYITGSYSGNFGYGSFSSSNNGGVDGYILMIDSTGTEKNLKTYGGSGNDEAFFSIVDRTGKVYTCGYFSNTVAFGGSTLTSSGVGDAFFAKTKIDSTFTFLPKDTVLCNSSSYTISSLINASSYLWNNSSTSSSITVNTPGWYKLRITLNCDYIWDSIYVGFSNCTNNCSPCNNSTLPINAGLIACYPFNGNANDETTNGHNGTVNGATLTSDRFGYPNSAYAFNGTTNYISIPYSPAFNFTPTGAFSLCAWVNPSVGITNFGSIIIKSTNVGLGFWDYGLYHTSSYKGMTGYSNNNLLNSLTTVPANQWYFLTATYSDGDWKIYVNCQLDNSRINSGLKITQSNGGLAIGRKGDSNSDFFSGKIDDVRIYNRLLTLAEIQQMYTCNNYVTVFTNNDSTICGGSPKTLKATGTADHFLWSTGDTSSTIVVFPNTTTTYWVRGQVGTTSCYAFDTVTITTLPVPTIQSINDTTICKGSVLTLTSTGNANHYLWSTGDTTSSINITATKDTVVWVRGQNGSIACFATDTIHIKAADFPVINTLNDTFTCAGNSITLSTSGNAGRFLWSNGDTTSSLSITPAKDTILWVRGQIGNLPCYSFDSVKITVYPYIPLNIGNDTTLCEGNTYTLTAPAGMPRTWFNGDTSKSVIITVVADTVNFLPQKFWVNAGFNNCMRSDTILIYSIPKPRVAPLLNGKNTICQGGNIGIGVNRIPPSSKIIWSTGDTAKSISVSPMITTTYFVSYLNNLCGFKDSITINVIPKPIISISPDDTICVGESTTLTVRGTVSYLWNTTATDSDLVVSPSKTTTYWVIGNNGTCNSDTQKVTIVVVPKPNSIFAATPLKGTIPLNVNFDNQSAYANNYLWDFGDGDTSTSFSPSHLYEVKGSYLVTLIAFNDQGCSDTSEITIIADEKFVISIPTIFSPNGDQLNDIFDFYIDGAKSWEGLIFDRWGEQLYTWKSPDGKGWDGTYKGLAVQDGIYIYIINAKDNANYRHVYKGILTVVH